MGFAVIDLETTGLRPASDRIIEIGVVVLDAEGHEVRTWQTLVNPGRQVTATFIHGLRDADVADAPSYSEIIPELSELLQGRAVVAHNAVFDVSFINAAFSRAAFPVAIPREACVCTMELSKIYLPEGRHGLSAAAERAGLASGVHHRALADASTAAGLLAHYMAAEARGTRFRDTAVARDGYVTEPAQWQDAQRRATALAWPASLL